MPQDRLVDHPAFVGEDTALAHRGGQHGVFAYEGGMVDEPVLRHARAVLARAER